MFTTHYDSDHIRGLSRLRERGISIRKAFDQGLSLHRHGKQVYTKYVVAVGDPNDNFVQDADEPDFVRHRIDLGHIERIGLEDQVEIRCVAVRGDTAGHGHDLDLDPSDKPGDFNENPGSIALLIRLGDFEFYTAGDQTDNDWRAGSTEVEERVLDSGVMPNGNDIDLLKVSHHGSDTSTSAALASRMLPEVAVVSTTFVSNQGLPKKVVLQQLQENRSFVLITGDGIDPVGSKYSADHELQWRTSVRSTGTNDSPSNRALDLVQPALQDRTRRSGGESWDQFLRLSQPDVVDLQLKCRNPPRRNCSAEYDFEFG